MSDIALKVENLYKRYRLGAVDRQAFKEDVISWWAAIRGKPDPYEQYITSNDLAAIQDSEEMKSLKARYVWALQDINFEVKKGEIVGIIGKNGAGKSTLLKILSKTTTPTKGQVKVNGRIASLLEVGTGFHGELTGRENIYLNGAILGMKRHEIKTRLDEIIAFAGVDAYIDTPVKRYSSGMYVRLAFAVGAHLLSDILIVDEVLAVGDAEFQKKCIGKMQDVSKGEGKTVLFVSHNMQVIKNLCSRGILLKNGRVEIQGNMSSVMGEYMKKNIDISVSGEIPFDAERYCTGEAQFTRAFLIDEKGEKIKNIFFKQKIKLHLELNVVKTIPKAIIAIHILDSEGEELAMVTDETAILTNEKTILENLEIGIYAIDLEIPNIFFEGDYNLNILLAHYPSGSDIDFVERVYSFTIERLGNVGEADFQWTKHGHVLLNGQFQINK